MGKIKHICLYEPDDEELNQEYYDEYDNKIIFQDKTVRRDPKIERLIREYYYPNDIWIGNKPIEPKVIVKKRKKHFIDIVLAVFYILCFGYTLNNVIQIFAEYENFENPDYYIGIRLITGLILLVTAIRFIFVYDEK